MTHLTLQEWTWIWIGLALVSCAWLFIQTAPYGRHGRDGWGPRLPHRAGWIVMESVSPLVLTVVAVRSVEMSTPVLFLLSLWILHYVYRAVIYPFRARWSGRQMPLVIMLSAVFFNTVNGGLNGLGMSLIAEDGFWTANTTWFGAALFFIGLSINLRADQTLFGLRKPGESGYRIPEGGMYRWISCPNYFGEIIEWIGFALMASTLPAISFAVWTAANLIPRAISHHKWYKERFPHYPAERRALVPFLL